MKNYVLIRHKVIHFPSWEAVFDKHQKNAKEYNLTVLRVMRDLTNPNAMTVLFEAEDLEKAKEFMASDCLKQAMKKAGVLCDPEISYLTEASKSNSNHVF